MSSRNERLSAEEREKAAVIIDALREAKMAFKKGERNASELTQIVKDRISTELLAKLDYVESSIGIPCKAIEKVGDEESLIVIAANFGDVRLIDNVILNRKQ